MSTEYKPLFNRTYLKVLMVGCVLAIIWLSSLGQQQHRSQGNVEDQPLYWLQIDDAGDPDSLPDQLQVILPTDSAFSGAEQDRQHWRGSILRERLQQQLGTSYRYDIQVADDYLGFTLYSNDQQLPALSPLMQALAQPVDVDQWQAQLKQAQARRYLQQQAPEQQLLARLGDRLGKPGPLPLEWQRMFRQPRYLLAGVDAESRAEELSDSLPAWQAVEPTNHHEPVLAGSARLEMSSARSMLMMANTVPARTRAGFMRQHLIVATSQLALTRYPPSSDSHYRLKWKSLHSGGYQAVIFFSELPLNSSQLQAFRDRITPELVEEARTGLRQRLANSDRTVRWQLNVLQLIARYQLPMDSLKQYLKELDGLDAAAVAAAARQRFDPQQQYTLRVDNQP